MYMDIYFSLLLLAGYLCGSQIETACPYKECSCGGASISCQNRGLKTMPALLTANNSTGYTILNLDQNSITSIPNGSLPPELEEIYLFHSPIAHIDDNAFDGSSSTLTTLFFNGANFTKMPDALLHLNNLRHLTIYDSVIGDWNVNAMNHISQTIVTLYLQNVGLKYWPDWIKNFTQTVELSVLYSTLTDLPDDALDNFNSLNLLSIIHCQLTSVPKTISNLKSLNLLQLLQNNISNITWLPHSGQLSSLNLNINSLSDPVHLEQALTPLAGIVKYVSLKQNSLQSIPNLTSVTSLDDLDLTYNRISDTVSGAMPDGLYNLRLTGNLLPSIPRIYLHTPYVTYMYLGFNLITTIKDTDFPLWVTEVSLENNLISELTNTSFPVNSGIEYLVLNGNPLTRIDALAFSNLLNLGDLEIRNIKLTRLPLALSHLTGLKLLDARENPSLVCTCVEKSLGPWLNGLLTVAGDCGVVSIKNFFTTLIQSCPA